MIGRIQSITGQSMSGIACIHFEDGSSVFVESGFGMRQLAAAFDAENPGQFKDKVIGQVIEYEVDQFGVMAEFKPNEGWEEK